MKTKMARKDLTDLFPPLMPTETDKRVESTATSKGHKHTHNPAARPSVGTRTPAQYRRNHIGKKQA